MKNYPVVLLVKWYVDFSVGSFGRLDPLVYIMPEASGFHPGRSWGFVQGGARSVLGSAT